MRGRPLDVARRFGESDADYAARLLRSAEERARKRQQRQGSRDKSEADLSHRERDKSQAAAAQRGASTSPSQRSKSPSKRLENDDFSDAYPVGSGWENSADDPRGLGGGGVSPPLRGGETPTDSPQRRRRDKSAVEGESTDDDLATAVSERLIEGVCEHFERHLGGLFDRLADHFERRMTTAVELAVRRALATPSQALQSAAVAPHEGTYGVPAAAALSPEVTACDVDPVATATSDIGHGTVAVETELSHGAFVPAASDPARDKSGAEDDQRLVVRSLRAGFLLTLWDACVLTAEGAAVPWTDDDVLALLEAYRAAGNVALPEDAFGVVMRWFDLYAHDQMVKRADKTPRHFGRHFSEYLAAAVPPRGQYDPGRTLARWCALSGETYSETDNLS